jgi:hypothetical protein
LILLRSNRIRLRPAFSVRTIRGSLGVLPAISPSGWHGFLMTIPESRQQGQSGISFLTSKTHQYMPISPDRDIAKRFFDRSTPGGLPSAPARCTRHTLSTADAEKATMRVTRYEWGYIPLPLLVSDGSPRIGGHQRWRKVLSNPAMDMETRLVSCLPKVPFPSPNPPMQCAQLAHLRQVSHVRRALPFCSS